MKFEYLNSWNVWASMIPTVLLRNAEASQCMFGSQQNKGHQNTLMYIELWSNSWMLMSVKYINQSSKVSIYYYHALSHGQICRDHYVENLYDDSLSEFYTHQLLEQYLFSVDSLLMDCINLKFVRWLRFNSIASYWLGIFLINQPIDFKSPFLTLLLTSLCAKSPDTSVYLAIFMNTCFFNAMIPFGDICKTACFPTSKCLCVCMNKDIHAYSNMAFSRKYWLLWMVAAVCIKTDWMRLIPNWK